MLSVPKLNSKDLRRWGGLFMKWVKQTNPMYRNTCIVLLNELLFDARDSENNGLLEAFQRPYVQAVQTYQGKRIDIFVYGSVFRCFIYPEDLDLRNVIIESYCVYEIRL